jgi:hypothetical protein
LNAESWSAISNSRFHIICRLTHSCHCVAADSVNRVLVLVLMLMLVLLLLLVLLH